MIGDGGLGSEARKGATLLLRGARLGARAGSAVRRVYRRGTRRVRVLLGLLDAVVGLQDVADGGARRHLRALLEGAAALDHGDHHQGLVPALRPAGEPVYVVAARVVARQLARAALADRGQVRALEDRLGRALLRRDAAQSFDHGFDLGLGGVHASLGLRGDILDNLAALVGDLLAYVRGDEGAAVVECGVG